MLTQWAVLLLTAAAGGAAVGAWGRRRDAAAADRVWRALRAAQPPAGGVYDPAMTRDLPEVARRYFAAAIAPGTPLARTVELRMEGRFILNGRSFRLEAEQILAPPHGFVWKARMSGGALGFSGSDGYHAGETSWTRFRLLGLLPVARAGGTEDHARAAAARMALETVWTPAALLPQAGAEWRQTGADQAEVRLPAIPGIEPIHLGFDAAGHVVEAVTQRWSDANPERRHRLQPFGGHMSAHACHQGFTIPTRIKIGNQFGTPAFAPFLEAHLTSLMYTTK